MKIQDFFPDIENYTFGDWCAWFSIVFAIVSVFMGCIAFSI